MRYKGSKTPIFSIAVLMVIFTAVMTAYACNVPVFRYALERWPADPYRVVVFLDGEPDNAAREAIEILESSAGDRPGGANQIVTTVDISGGLPVQWQKLYESMEYKQAPVLAVQFPHLYGLDFAVWSSGLSAENARLVLDSPARKTVADRLLDGESAVFLMIDSGNKAKDDKTAAFIEKHITALETELVLPTEIEGNEAAMPVDVSNGPEVRIDFSLLRISRNDPKEAALVSMLMFTEPDLGDYIEEPMVFPVFGRGRALYALIGEGITADNIHTACSFMTGACSCEVKSLNPGVDILIRADWDNGLGESWIQDVPLPPLVSISDLKPVDNSDDQGDGIENTPVPADKPASAVDDPGDGEDTPSPLTMNIVIVITAILAAVAVASVILVRKNSGGKR